MELFLIGLSKRERMKISQAKGKIRYRIRDGSKQGRTGKR